MDLSRKIGFIAAPLLFLSILLFEPIEEPNMNRVIAVASWMIIWWILEVFPIYITALLPMVFFPALGILPSAETFAPYGSPIVFLFFGGFILALALEKKDLHKRLAFVILNFTGSRPNQVILGFMLVTAFLAMWVSNTATSIMILPIAISVLQLFDDQFKGSDSDKLKFKTVLLLSVAYSANIGGLFTLIGTPPNIVFSGFYLIETGQEFSFISWLTFGIPIGVTLLVITYFVMTRILFRIKGDEIKGFKQLINKEQSKLGVITKAQILVILIFSGTVGLWVFASLLNDLMGTRIFNNTNIAVGGAILLFITPVNLKQNEYLLSWRDTKDLPWGILLLFGGGLSLAKGLESAGVIDLIGTYFTESVNVNPTILLLILTAFALFATEIMSNVALVSVLLPVVFGIAASKNIDPLYLTIPVTIAASCAFMLPVSTPPNAVVFSSGFIKVKEMVKAGIWLNFAAVIVIVLIFALLFR